MHSWANITTRSGRQNHLYFLGGLQSKSVWLVLLPCVIKRARLSAWFMVPAAPSHPQGHVRSPWDSRSPEDTEGPTGLAPVAVVPGVSWGRFLLVSFSKPLQAWWSFLADWLLRELYPIFSRSPVQIFLDSSSDFVFQAWVGTNASSSQQPSAPGAPPKAAVLHPEGPIAINPSRAFYQGGAAFYKNKIHIPHSASKWQNPHYKKHYPMF